MAKKRADAPTQANEEVITSYKGFSADWTCRGYQFKVGETFTHEGPVAACEGGFHACERPLDVFAYYPPAGSRFAVVEQSGDLSRHDDDTKVASRHIAIKAEISLAELIKLSIDRTFSKALPVDPGYPASSTGDYGVALASGFYGRAMASESSAIVLVNRAAKVGDQGIKAGVWYSLDANGEFVED